MPFDCSDNTDDFRTYFSRVNNIFETYPAPSAYVIGHLNANVTMMNNQCSSKFGETLLKFCNDEGILMADYDYLPEDSNTFTSSAHNTVSWLDHILTTNTGRDLIEHIDIVNNFASSDLLLLLNCEWFHVMEHKKCNLFHVLIGPPSILLQLMAITIKLLSYVILQLIMACLVAIKYLVIIQIIDYP